MKPGPHGSDARRSTIIEAVRSSPCSVVGVTAAAGYGKSILLAQWARSERRAVASVALDRSHDDVDRFVTAVATAFAEAAPRVLRGQPVSASGEWEPTAHELAAALRACPRPFVILIDDLHLLRSPACHEALRTIVAAVPSASQIVTASRHVQPHLARFRVGREVAELTDRNLALDAAQARAVAAQAGVELPAPEAHRLVQVTEGWPAGIALAVLGSREGHHLPSTVAGDDRHVADYFQTEVLAPLSADLQEFLRRSAVLDRLSGGLCDEVLERTDATARLRDLETTTLFITPEGAGRHSYRHHRLFREFLLAELQREDARVVRRLHSRAAHWYEATGAPMVAVGHLLATDEHERTAALVQATAPTAWLSGEVDQVQDWLAALGARRIAEDPRLVIVQCWLAVLTGQPAVAEHWLASLEEHVRDGDGVSPSVSSELALLRSATCPAGPDQALRDARWACEGQDHHGSARRAQALALCGESHLLLGDSDEAVECLERAVSAGEERKRPDLVAGCRAILAWILMDRGAWDDGAAQADRALLALRTSTLVPQPSTLLSHGASARAHLHFGDSRAARRDLAAAMATRSVSTYARPFPAVKGRLEVAKLLWATGDHGGARMLLREIHDVFRERPDLGVLREEFDGFAQMTQGEAVPGPDSVTAPLTPAELRLLPYLQTHLTIAEIGARLFVTRNTANSEIASIYRKLGVSSRGSAVDRAIVLGLLGR